MRVRRVCVAGLAALVEGPAAGWQGCTAQICRGCVCGGYECLEACADACVLTWAGKSPAAAR
eukprot:946482-Rhodomonas_salina.1